MKRVIRDPDQESKETEGQNSLISEKYTLVTPEDQRCKSKINS